MAKVKREFKDIYIITKGLKLQKVSGKMYACVYAICKFQAIDDKKKKHLYYSLTDVPSGSAVYQIERKRSNPVCARDIVKQADKYIANKEKRLKEPDIARRYYSLIDIFKKMLADEGIDYDKYLAGLLIDE